MPQYNHPKRQHKKNSIAWTYFTPEGDTATCKICGRSYKYTNGGTSMLLRHVKFHQDQEKDSGLDAMNAQNGILPTDNSQLVNSQASPALNNPSLLLPTTRNAQIDQTATDATVLGDWNIQPQQRQVAHAPISPKADFGNGIVRMQHSVPQTEITPTADPSMSGQRDHLDNHAQSLLPTYEAHQEAADTTLAGVSNDHTSYYQHHTQNDIATANSVGQMISHKPPQPVDETRFQSHAYPPGPDVNTQIPPMPLPSQSANLQAETSNMLASYPQSDFEHDIVDLFLNNNIPYNIIESPEFIKIFKKLVPYKLYSSRLLRLIVITKIHLHGNQILENLTQNSSQPSGSGQNEGRQ